MNPPYKHIKQLPYCCVPASLSMILDRRGIAHDSQEQIGWELGLVIPSEVVKQFTLARTAKIKPKAGWGTQVNKPKYSLNNYFIKKGIDLVEQNYFIGDIGDVPEFILGNIKNDIDMVVCFNHKQLRPDKDDTGHVAVIQEFRDAEVVLVDPRMDEEQSIVEYKKLIHAMQYHGRKNGAGFWCIGERKQHGLG